jgi:hypothetical protein
MGDLTHHLRKFIRDQQKQEDLELRQQETKNLEQEHFIESKKSKEKESIIEWNGCPQKTEAVGDARTEPKEREVMAWLRETWINEGNPGGTTFFAKLKKYVNQKGSPIVEHYSAGKDAGFRWQTSAGTTGTMTKKTLLNKVSIFNNKPQQNTTKQCQ